MNYYQLNTDNLKSFEDFKKILKVLQLNMKLGVTDEQKKELIDLGFISEIKGKQESPKSFLETLFK